MNWIMSHLANRKELLQGAVQSGRLLQKWGATKRLLAKEQKGLFQARSLPLGEGRDLSGGLLH